MKTTFYSIFYSLLFFLLVSFPGHGQAYSDDQVQQLVEQFKNDPRGPYLRIRWFCDDGTVREPKDPCPDDVGGVQHASYKDQTLKLRERNQLYFGEILAAAENEPFWDAGDNYSRLKQYQLNKYLASVDDGWVLRKAQYYRGAIQSEDEEAWGIEFYKWLMADDSRLAKNFYLIRQSLKDIPHAGDDNLSQRLRSESKVIADSFPRFMDIRVKIHGQPEASDQKLVADFREKYQGQLSPKLRKDLQQLSQTMEAYYAPIDFYTLTNQIEQLETEAPIKSELLQFTSTFTSDDEAQEVVPAISDLLCDIRTQIYQVKSEADRLQLLDISLKMERVLLQKASDWETRNLKELLGKIYQLSYATAGTGSLELWEWEEISAVLAPIKYENVSVGELQKILNTARNVVQWSAAMAKVTYGDVVEKYSGFEPLANGFIDDRVRSSVALPLGQAVADLAAFLAQETQIENNIMNTEDASTARGLNPGYAMGELVVVSGNPEGTEVSNDKIYVFKRPPSDLKPVAGIATVDEGNLVSHVQLLARNLGIPNAALTDNQLGALKSQNGEKVFYAVSNSGTVILKPASEMTEKEKKLFSVEERQRTKIAVPIDQIRLDRKEIINMREIDASASGKLAGPKAANLGQLKKMFPDEVVEGLVIPFGIFRDHMDLPMPGQSVSYWQFLTKMFQDAEAMRENGTAENEVESFQLEQLEILRDAIKSMTLKPEFVQSLQQSFESIFGNPIGEVPVFLRSDTNMEDLKEFTGAGLNLTLFNVVEEQKILDGIKSVWASPYTERSFKWRQQYLSNPENVFPSILVIPSVDVDYSGVMITKGINEGTEDDLTVAFSRGAGGAVDGQAAETRLVTARGNHLLAPARQGGYIRLPASGGVRNYTTGFDQPILNEKNIQDLREVARAARTKIPQETDTDYEGAYDIELGFKDDKLYLFQIRPFVENKNALSSDYLESISPKIDTDRYIDLDQTLD